MNLGALDLNLLLVFDVLMAERQVTNAARRLGRSQPAISNALARLRSLLNDPLFIQNRTSGQMVPTRRAEELAPAVQNALRALENAINMVPFNPRKAHFTIRLGTTDYIEQVLLPELVRRLHRTAPNCKLLVTRLGGVFEIPAEALESGVLDVAIGFLPSSQVKSQAKLSMHVLFRDRWICIAKQTNQPRLTREAFVRRGQVMLSYPKREGSGLVDRKLWEHGLQRQVALTVPHFSTIPALVLASELIGVVPERLVSTLGIRGKGLARLRIPLDLEPISVGLIWHARSDADPAKVWFRNLVMRSHAAK
jgi:DNA-binding transcriptional LysR family regulator